MALHIQHEPLLASPAKNPDGYRTLGNPGRCAMLGVEPIPVTNIKCHPWTARRCQRILRPLLSHIASLRKERLIANAEEQHKLAPPPRKRPLPEQQATFSSAKRPKYTYSLKGTKKRSTHAQTGAKRTDRPRLAPLKSHLPTSPSDMKVRGCEIEVQKRVLQRLRGHHSRPLLGVEPNKLNPRDKHLPGRVNEDACRVPLARGVSRLVEASASSVTTSQPVLRALAGVLRATQDESPQSASKSLLSMCLRRIPQLAGDLEQLERKEDEVNGTKSVIQASTISSDLYSELEDMGHMERGWKHLPTVIRAHAVHFIKQAFLEGLLDVAACGLLVKLCIQMQAYHEAEILTAALVAQSQVHQEPYEEGPSIRDTALPVSQTPFLTKPRDECLEYCLQPPRIYLFVRISLPVRIMDIAAQSDRPGLALRQASSLLKQCPRLFQRGSISVDQFRALWWTATDLIGTRDGSADALLFVSTSISLLCGQFHQKQGLIGDIDLSPPKVLFSSLTSIAAMSILSREYALQEDCVENDAAHFTARRVELVINTALAATSKVRGEDAKRVRYLLHLVLFLSTVTKGASISSQYVQDTWRESTRAGFGSSRRAQLYDDTMEVVARVAHQCHRGSDISSLRSGQPYLVQLCTRLATVDCLGGSFQRMQADAALLLAERSCNLADLVFAEELRSRRSPSKESPSGPQAVRSGYRWEAGISEWVPLSPESVRKKRRPELEFNDWSDKTLAASRNAEGNDKKSSFTPARRVRRLVVCDPNKASRTANPLSSDEETEMDFITNKGPKKSAKPARRDRPRVKVRSRQYPVAQKKASMLKFGGKSGSVLGLVDDDEDNDDYDDDQASSQSEDELSSLT